MKDALQPLSFNNGKLYDGMFDEHPGDGEQFTRFGPAMEMVNNLQRRLDQSLAREKFLKLQLEKISKVKPERTVLDEIQDQALEALQDHELQKLQVDP